MNRAPRVKVGQSLGHFLPILSSLISAFPYTLQISADQHHHQAYEDKNIRGQNYLDGDKRGRYSRGLLLIEAIRSVPPELQST